MAAQQLVLFTLLVCLILPSSGLPPINIIDIIFEIVSGALPGQSSNVTEPNYAYFHEYQVGPTINTTSGPVQGAKLSEGYAFYSVPFAQPPER